MKNKYYLIFIFSFLIINIQYAQKFGLAATVGVNLSQIDGDNQRGFKKKGVVSGLRSIVNLTEKWTFNTEILYSEHGTSPSDKRNISINLTYVEVPAYFSYQFTNNKKGFSRIYAGASYGRLFSYATAEFITLPRTFNQGIYLPIDSISGYFNTTDIGVFTGFHVLPFNDSWGIDLRYTVSANLLFNKNDVGRPIQNKSLRSYFFSLRFFYEINHIGTKKRKKRRRR